MKDNRNDLTEGVVWKKLIRFFLPIAATTCLQQLYNAVDGMIVGKFVGTEALAAVGGSPHQIINLLIGFFVSATAGASIIIAQIYGAGKQEDIERASGNAIAVCGITGVILGLFGFFASRWMLTFLKTPADTIADAELYLKIYFSCVPVVLIMNMESGILRAVGDSMDTFRFMVVGCVTNIVLDFVFVYFFHWGVAGVAIATVASQVVSMVFLTRKLMTVDAEYRLRLSAIKLSGRYLVSMVRLGVPAGLQSSMYSVSNMIIQVGVNTLGTVAVASWSMSGKVDGIFWAISNALGAAVTTFIGQNMGAGRFDRMKTCVKQGLILAISTTLVLSGLIMLTSIPLLHILTDDDAVVETTWLILKYFVPYYFTWSLIEILSAVLRGAGDAVNPVIIIGLGICLFRVIWMLTIFRYFGTLDSLCLTYVSSWTITGIALLIYYRRGRWLERAKSRLMHN